MNKAFIREADPVDPKCPRCGSTGLAVFRETLAVHLPADSGSGLTDSAWYCPFERCEVVYFDQFDRVALCGQVKTPVFPKDPAAPICPCFGLTTDEIEQDLDEGTVSRTRACVQRAQSPEARCGTTNPSGQPCVAEVQRYYMKRRAERDAG